MHKVIRPTNSVDRALALCLAVLVALGPLWVADAVQAQDAPLLARAPGAALSLQQLEALPASDHIVVKFHEGLRVRPAMADGAAHDDAVTGLTGLDRAQSSDLDQALAETGVRPGTVRRLFTRPETLIDRDRDEGQRLSGRQLADLNNYYMIAVPPGMTAARLADRLNRLDSVEFAEPMPVPVSMHHGMPAPTAAAADRPATTPDFTRQQGYMDAAPIGIGINQVRPLGGTSGLEVRVVDIEKGWRLDHEDLLLPPDRILIPQVSGVLSDDISHGDAVLGILVGRSNAFGITGIVPEAVAYVASMNQSAISSNVANAINVGSDAIEPGDVILLEVQTRACADFSRPLDYYGPHEWFQSTFDAVSTATARGRVVVAAAGNGAVDLDSPNCQRRFDRSFRDSGAIIVGAGDSRTRRQSETTSFGSRVDVQAWNDNVTTLGYGDLFVPGGDPLRYYTAGFGGTSAASAIVAGVVASIQGRLRFCNMPPLTSTEMRELLVRTGSPQQAGAGHIGPQPDIQAALADLDLLRNCGPNPFEPTTTVLFGSPSSTLGGTITFTATVRQDILGGARTRPVTRGEVSFRLNNIEFGRMAPNARGEAQITASGFPAGDHFVSAYYLGDLGIPRSNATIPHEVIDRNPPPPPPPPANNRFANRVTLTLPTAIEATTVGATRETAEPRLLNSDAHKTTLWWTVTPAAAGRLVIDTFGSEIETVVGVFTGSSLATLTPVAQGGTHAFPLPNSRLSFAVQANTAYAIVVSGADGAEGAIRLNVAREAPGPVATTTLLLGPTEHRAGTDLHLSARVSALPGIAPTGSVEFLRNGVAVQSVRLSNDGVARLRIPNLPVGSFRVSARYLGASGFLASDSQTLLLRVTRDGAGFRGAGSVFNASAECAPVLGSGVHGVRVGYSPSELNAIPSGVSIIWPGGSEHLAVWGPMAAGQSFRGGAGRSTWTRFVFYPTRPLIRVVSRQVTQPAGAILVDAQEVYLRLRIQNFAATPGCSITLAAVMRRN